MSDLVERLRSKRVNGKWPGESVVDPDCQEAATALEQRDARIKELERDRDAALGYATRFLQSFVSKNCNPIPEWKPLPDLIGVLTQIDNASTVVDDVRLALTTAERDTLERAAKVADDMADERMASWKAKVNFGIGTDQNVGAYANEGRRIATAIRSLASERSAQAAASPSTGSGA